jgi:hypothetical protein
MVRIQDAVVADHEGRSGLDTTGRRLHLVA